LRELFYVNLIASVYAGKHAPHSASKVRVRVRVEIAVPKYS